MPGARDGSDDHSGDSAAILRRTQRITPAHTAPTSTDSAGARPSVIQGRSKKAYGPNKYDNQRESRKYPLTIPNTCHNNFFIIYFFI